jgi:hypothetical protein
MTAAERGSAISHNYTIVARLADGVPLARVGRLETFAAHMSAEHPDTHRDRRPPRAGD